MLPRNLTVLCTALVIAFACHLMHRRTRAASMVGEVFEMIDQFYVEPVDERALMTAAMNGMTSTLDQHSEYIPPVNYEAFQDSIHQEFAGIGIYVDQPAENEPVRVVTPLVGSPALRSGLLPGDQIIRVDGEDVSKMDIRSVSDRLRGPVATTVELVVQREGEAFPITVQRDTIQLESVIGDDRDEQDRWVYRLSRHPDIAYVRMTSFGDKTVAELRGVLVDLTTAPDIAGLVLDLRGNGGGLLTAAVDVSNMFLDSGKIVSTKTRGGVVESEFVATPGVLVPPELPVAILIDENSASASEIVAAALQDHARAVIVGARSYGKGTVQNILPLEYGRSALRLTVAKYYRPSDLNIHRGKDDTEDDVWGVRPDPGMSVRIEDENLLELAKFWQEASYPSLRNRSNDANDEEEGNEEPEEDPAAKTPLKVLTPGSGASPKAQADAPSGSAWELDLPLQRAVKAIRQKVEQSTVSPKQAA